MMNLRQRLRFLVGASLTALLLAGCGHAHLVHREVLALTGGGSGESWIVVHELEGTEGRPELDGNRYIVYQCVPAGCRGVAALPGSERSARRR
jgi:hypothetical protein